MFSSVKNVSGVLGLQVLVQSHKSPEHVDQRIENFIHEMQVGDAFSWTDPSVFPQAFGVLMVDGFLPSLSWPL